MKLKKYVMILGAVCYEAIWGAGGNAMRLLTYSLIPFLLLPISAHAQEQNDAFLLNFEGICLRNLHDISLVKGMVEILDAKEAPEHFSKQGAPIDGKLLGSWLVEKDGLLLVVATSEGKFRDKMISTCSVISKLEDTENAIKRMEDIFDTEKIADDQEGFQRYRSYTTSISGNRILINAITGVHPSTRSIINLNAAYPIP